MASVQKKNPTKISFLSTVNFDLRSIFIAVPKTGSSSIRSQVSKRRQLKRNSLHIRDTHCTITQVRDLLYLYYLLRRNRNSNYPTDVEQVSSDAELRAQATETFKTFFKFASVRTPWQRVVSLYYRTEGKWPKIRSQKDISFDQFCEQLRSASDTCLHPTRCANQLDWMIDETGALAVDYVLRLESLEEGLREIKERTNGRLDLKVEYKNVNKASKSGTYRSLYTEKTKNHVAELFKRDIEFFGYDF